MSPRVKMPPTGVIGVDITANKELRVDFRPGQFEILIEQKGYRVLWERGARCPCLPLSTEIKNPDPNCPKCKGTGFFYFGPVGYALPLKAIGNLNELQQSIITASGGAVVRAIMTNLQAVQRQHEQAGGWQEGVTRCTTRPQNRLGYLDRITNIDSTIAYWEVIEVKDPAVPLKLRYPVVSLNNMESMTKRWTEAQFNLTADGKITFVMGNLPAKGERLSIHYLIYPRWLIVDHPHGVRSTFISKKKKPIDLDTPIGDLAELAVEGMLRYDFALDGVTLP